MSQLLDYRIRVKIRTNPAGITKPRPPSYCVMPYQSFEAAGFEQDLSGNAIKDRL